MFVPEAPQFYPEYLSDPNVLICPSSSGAESRFTGGRWNCDGDGDDRGDPSQPYCPCRFDDLSYYYVPWIIQPKHYCLDPAQANGPNYESNVSGAFLTLYATEMSDAMNAWVSDGVFDGMTKDYSFVHENGQNYTLYFLREGVERFMITDINNPAASAQAQSEVVVMYDQFDAGEGDAVWASHLPGGSNVLYFDAHVSFVRYPDTHPLNKTFAYLWGNA